MTQAISTKNDDWPLHKISDLSEKITVGFVGSMSHLFQDSGIPLLRGQNIEPYKLNLNSLKYISEETHKKWGKSALLPGDVAVVRVGYPGTACVIPQDIGPLNAASLVIIRTSQQKLNPYYLSYVLNSEWGKQKINSRLVGAAQQVFNTKVAADMTIPTPSVDVQNKIVDILGALDEKIELNRKMNETLEQMGQALFRHYFIDNLEAEKWRDGKFSDVADVLTGKGSTKSQLSEHGTVPLYGANGIMGTSENFLYNEPLVITGRVGTLGKVRAVTGKAWFSDNVLVMKPKVQSFGFIYHLARAFDYKSMNRGSTQPLVTQTDLRNKKIRIPDNQTLERFEQQFSNLFEQQQNNEQQTQTLITLRDTLLPRLISGKIRV